MKSIKRFLGWVWMLTGPLVIIALLYSAFQNINTTGKADINKPLPWIIIICIFTPVAIGFTIFGWYCRKGEYEGELTEESV